MSWCPIYGWSWGLGGVPCVTVPDTSADPWSGGSIEEIDPGRRLRPWVPAELSGKLTRDSTLGGDSRVPLPDLSVDLGVETVLCVTVPDKSADPWSPSRHPETNPLISHR